MKPQSKNKELGMKILLIGCGKMGGAMLSRWVVNPDHSYTVVDPAATGLPDGVEHVTSPQALAGRTFDMMIIAVKPQMIPDVLPNYKDNLAKDGVAVSIAAGFSLQKLALIMGHVGAVRVMPNLPALIGEGVTGLYANQLCNDEQKDAVTRLIDSVGRSVWVDSEEALDRLTAVSGSGPGYVFQFMESYMAAAETLGFSPRAARELVTQTIIGAATMASMSDDSVSALRQSVTSKGGTTEAGLKALNDDNRLDALLSAATGAAYQRALELQ
jgi:pyrroline-5-carboxylate reductase